jgi:hypothetical protein
VPGTARILDYSQVTITDSVQGLLFAGFVFSSQASNLYPNAQNDIVVICMDNSYLADKHYYGIKADGTKDSEKINQYAGNIATELLNDYLAQEGITANYAIRRDSTQANFAAGTLTNVTASTNVGNGDLELTLAGSTVTKVETSTADFNSFASMSGIDTANGQLQLASHSTLKLTASCAAGYNNPYLYWTIWKGSYVIQTGDFLSYNLWINSGSPMIKCAIDLVFSDGTNIRDSSAGNTSFYIGGLNVGLPDQNNIPCHPGTDLNGYANDQWYARHIGVGYAGITGKTVVQCNISFQGASAGTYTAYVYDVVLFDTGGTIHRVNFYYGAGPHASILQPNTSAKVSANGYSGVQLTPIIGYEATGTRTANSTSITAVGNYRKSLVSWSPIQPANTGLVINTSIDGGATFQPATNFAQVTGLMPGASLTGQTMQTQQVLSLTGKDPIYTPILLDITWAVFPSYVAAKSDTSKTFKTSANWAAGAAGTNMQVLANGDVQPVMFTRNWGNASLANLTLFGGVGLAHYTARGYYVLGVNGNAGGNAEVRSRFDFAGSWTDFTMSIDLQFVASNLLSAVIWGNTSWTNSGPDTYAYKCELTGTQIAMARGSNGGPTGSTAIGSPFIFPTGLVANDWHTVTITRVGNVHTAFFDGVQVCQATDSTWTAAGQVGIRFANQGGNNIFHQGYFNNFGISTPTAIIGQAPAPQEVTNSVSIGSITVGNSLVQWGQTLPPGALITVSVSVKGGAYVACTNGAVIPGLTPGTVIAAGTVQFKIQMQVPTPDDYFALNGFTWWVSSAYTATGTRISPVLSLNPVGRVGSSLVGWNALLPAGTTLGVDTSPTGGAPWTDVSGSNGGTIPGYTVQPDPYLDNFPINTSANYTNTFLSSGSAGTATFDTANSRLVFSGGTNAALLYPSLSFRDGYVECITDRADQAGIGLRWSNASNGYFLLIRDDQGSAPQQTIQLWKNVAGVKTQIGASTSIVFQRNAKGANTYHLIHFEIVGTTIMVNFDGTQVISTTDNSLAGPGSAFLIENGTGRFYNFRVQQYGDDLTGLNVYTRLRLASTDPTVTPQVLDVTVSAHGPSIGNGALIPTTAYAFQNGNLMDIGKCLTDLANKSVFPSPFNWDIDKNFKLRFQAKTATPAPFCVATANGDFLVAGLSVLNSSPAYRNDQYIIGGFDTQSKTEIKLGDSQTQTWTLGYPVAAPIVSGDKPIITINAVVGGVIQYPGTPQVVGVQGVDVGKDFYYAVGSTQITQDPSETPLVASSGNIPGEALVIVYNGTIPVTSHAFDATEQAALAILEGAGRSGIVTVVESFPGLNKAASDAVCAAKLAWGKVRGRTFAFQTLHYGLQTGMLVNVFEPTLGLNNAVCLVSKMTTTLKNVSTATNATGIQPWMVGELIEGSLTADWTRFAIKAKWQ